MGLWNAKGDMFGGGGRGLDEETKEKMNRLERLTKDLTNRVQQLEKERHAVSQPQGPPNLADWTPQTSKLTAPAPLGVGVIRVPHQQIATGPVIAAAAPNRRRSRLTRASTPVISGPRSKHRNIR